MISEMKFANWAVFLCLSFFGGMAFAAGAGTITHLSGTLSVQHPDGTVRILSQKSEVNPGDTLTTQHESYVQINFTDGSSITMRPNTTLKIEGYRFVQDKPQEDNAFLKLVKGGMRTVTGLVGKRGDQDAYKIKTSSATIGIRGSSVKRSSALRDVKASPAPATSSSAGVSHDVHRQLHHAERCRYANHR